ncbi:hypothetical protein J6524_10190 [Bradyrhizobium sp. WSM 1738]|nr:hypothetical protein [Bradyrhizobium hereditatis]
MDESSSYQECTPQWDLRFPGRLQIELDAFEAEDVEPRVDSDALQDHRLILNFEWPHEGDVLSLRAVYPDSYPFLRPQVLLRDPALFRSRRHVAPDGTICLIGRDGRQWTSSLTVRPCFARSSPMHWRQRRMKIPRANRRRCGGTVRQLRICHFA